MTGLAELPTGALILADGNQAILEIGTDGVVRPWAGKWNNDNPDPSVYDVDRKAARFRGLLDLAVDREGGVYAHERLENGYGVVRIRPDGIVVRVMGYGEGSCTEFGTPNVADLEGAVDRCELPGRRCSQRGRRRAPVPRRPARHPPHRGDPPGACVR